MESKLRLEQVGMGEIEEEMMRRNLESKELLEKALKRGEYLEERRGKEE